MRIDASRIFDQHTQQTPLGWRQMDNLMVLANLPARKVNVRAIFQREFRYPLIDTHSRGSAASLEPRFAARQSFLDTIHHRRWRGRLEQIIMDAQTQRLNGRLGGPKAVNRTTSVSGEI